MHFAWKAHEAGSTFLITLVFKRSSQCSGSTFYVNALADGSELCRLDPTSNEASEWTFSLTELLHLRWQKEPLAISSSQEEGTRRVKCVSGCVLLSSSGFRRRHTHTHTHTHILAEDRNVAEHADIPAGVRLCPRIHTSTLCLPPPGFKSLSVSLSFSK